MKSIFKLLYDTQYTVLRVAGEKKKWKYGVSWRNNLVFELNMFEYRHHLEFTVELTEKAIYIFRSLNSFSSSWLFGIIIIITNEGFISWWSQVEELRRKFNYRFINLINWIHLFKTFSKLETWYRAWMIKN